MKPNGYSQSFCLGASYFLTYAAGAAWFPLFTLFLEKRGLTGTQAGLVISVIFVAMFVALPFWGIGADKWGRKVTLIVSATISSISLFGFILGNTFVFFFGWTLFFAIVFNPVPMLLDSLTLDHTERSKRVSYGQLRMFGSLGWLIAAPIVGHFLEGDQISRMFPIAAVLYLGSIVPIFFLKSESSKSTGLELNLRNLAPVLKNPGLVTFLVMIFFIAVTSFCIQTFLAVYFDNLNASSTLIGWAFSFDGIGELPFYFVSAFLIQKFGLKRIFIVTIVVTAVRMYLYAFIHDPRLALLVEFSHGISFALYFVAMVESVNRLVPSEWRATGQSLMWASYSGLGAIVGNTLSGRLKDLTSVHEMFLWNAIALTVVILVAVILDRKLHWMGEPPASPESNT